MTQPRTSAKSARPALRFGPFLFDAGEPRLWRSDSPVEVTHRALILLHLLLARAGELVSKEDLIAHVWQRAAVSDAAVAKRVQELRAALADDPRAPTWIETVHGRGLRFIGAVTPVVADRAPLVGRADALRRLCLAAAEADRSHRRLVLVSGEAGIGKTSLLESFRGDPALAGALVGQGQCVPQGEGQPYLPVVAAVGELLRSDDGDSVARSLGRNAPAWSTLIPELGLTGPSADGVSQQRMLLELASALEWLAGARSVVLLLEDLHWADPSTIALLDFLSRRTLRARLLVVATFRDAALGAEARPLRALLAGRLGRDGCSEIKLGRLSEADVRAYLESRFSAEISESLGKAVYERTGGLPLFASWLVSDLVERRAVLRERGAWRLDAPPETISRVLPDSLQRFFELQLAALPPELAELLETAAVIGPAFSLDLLARVSGRGADRVESLAREIAGTSFLLGRAPSGGGPRLAIAHELLRDALYARVTPARRRALHGACAAELARAEAEPAELALHFRAAGAPREAAAAHVEAGRRAVAAHAHGEAASHFGAAVELLERADGAPELLVDSLLGQGASLVAAHGYGQLQVRELYHRAERLTRDAPDPRRRFAALNGLHSYYEVHGEIPRTAEFEPAMRAAAQAADDPEIRARAHAQIGERLLYMGELTASRSELELACSLCDLQGADPLAYATWTPVAAGAHGNLAMIECELGFADTGLRRAQRVIDDMTRRSQPYSVGLAHFFAAIVRIQRRELQESLPHQRALAEIAEDYGFADFAIWAQTMEGYLAAELGDLERGIELIRASLAELDASGVVTHRSGVMSGLASALSLAGRLDEALAVLEETASLVERTGEWVRRAQLQGIRAMILARDLPRQEAAVRENLELAYRSAGANGSRMWALRVSLGALALAQASGMDRARWRERVGRALAAMPEGRETRDQIEARALLSQVTP
ncbi:MAG TPA: AAA family ATPase [Myxococcota bacterium]|nr:AAA family ATPase [Myxococcota bacterium]